jgi:alkylation response protein AidB-like acyl-CoA dehydrogenase
MLPIHQDGIEIHRIEMLNGSKEFCQEFITDVRIPDSDRIGEVDQGWTVGTRWMYHERTVGGGSPYVTRPGGRRTRGPAGGARGLVRQMSAAGRLDSPRTRELIGEVHALDAVGNALTTRIADGIQTGRTTDQAAAITRLYVGVTAVRTSSIAFELSGNSAVAWSDDEDQQSQAGIGFLMRQAACIGGGTTEMSRNVISERVLGMPRERTVDKDLPFRDVPRSAPSR